MRVIVIGAVIGKIGILIIVIVYPYSTAGNKEKGNNKQDQVSHFALIILFFPLNKGDSGFLRICKNSKKRYLKRKMDS